MLLGNYFNNIDQNYKNFYFSGISFDTKNIKKNNIFFAIKGNKVDGNKFISNAIQKGSKINSSKYNSLDGNFSIIIKVYY